MQLASALVLLAADGHCLSESARLQNRARSRTIRLTLPRSGYLSALCFSPYSLLRPTSISSWCCCCAVVRTFPYIRSTSLFHICKCYCLSITFYHTISPCRLISLHVSLFISLWNHIGSLKVATSIHWSIPRLQNSKQGARSAGQTAKQRNSETVARAAAALLSPRAPADSEGTQPPALCSPPRKTFSSFIIIPLTAILKILICWLIAGSQSKWQQLAMVFYSGLKKFL